jgi:hypothetical protein
MLAPFATSFRSRAELQIEILALVINSGVSQRSVKRPRLTAADRFLWAWLCEAQGFRLFWTWRRRHGQPSHEPRESGWGAPRIHGELLKIGIDVGETSVSKVPGAQPETPSQAWRTFLENNVKSMYP